LANSQYATVLEEEGVCFLHIKTAERAHSPKKQWEKFKLSRSYLEALGQIDEQLKYWPDHVINRCKQRLTKIKQMILRMRKQSMREGSQRLVPIKKKTERREKTRELKAEAAAKVDLAIEKELLERLRQGTYGDIYNFSDKKKEEVDEVDEEEDEVETTFVEDFDEDDDEEAPQEETLGRASRRKRRLSGQKEEDWETAQALQGEAKVRTPSKPPRKKRRAVPAVPAVPRVEFEYEEERMTH
jgi:protein MAK16